jgi:hypothetical protein
MWPAVAVVGLSERFAVAGNRPALRAGAGGVGALYWPPMNAVVTRFRLFRWLALLGLVTVAPLPGRTFTSQDGKTFEGELINATADAVVVERATDRKRFTLPIAKLSAEDRTYITNWRKENPLLRLSFEVNKDKESVKKEKLVKVDDSFFRIIIKNDTAESTPPLSLVYSQFKTSTDPARKGHKKEVIDTVSGKFELPAIPAFRTYTVETAKVRVSDITRETKRTERDPTTGRAVDLFDYDKTTEDLSGIHFVVMFNKRQVAEWSTNGYQERAVDFQAAEAGPAKGDKKAGDKPKAAP